MSPKNERRRRARVASVGGGALALAGLAGACGTTTSESSGETHFLSYCSDSCAGGYACLCGVCTLACDEDDACEGASVCREVGGSCGPQICDVTCEADVDCTELGAEHRCVNGSCRAGERLDPEPECPEGCSVLEGYPGDAANQCLDLSPVEVACTCGSSEESLRCFVKTSDDSVWLLPQADFEPAGAWRECGAEESERVASSCDFAQCPPGARPPSTCAFEATCEVLDCGSSQYDERGCLRTRCDDDQDCGSDEYCSTFYSVGLSVLGVGDSCGFGGDGGRIPESFCRAVSPPGPLCNGTDEVRVFINNAGGFVAGSFDFTNPYGHDFLLVTGQCEYWAGYEDGGELRTGSFSDAEAEALEATIGWESLEAWSSYRDVEFCPDGGVATIQARAGTVSCGCGCDDDAPPALANAVIATMVRVDELGEQDAPAETDVRVVSVLVEAPEGVPSERIVTWQLERDIAEFATDPLYPLLRDSGERITDPEDAAALRGVRSVIDFGYDPPAAFSDNGDLYFFWLRDELPPEVEASLTALIEAQ